MPESGVALHTDRRLIPGIEAEGFVFAVLVQTFPPMRKFPTAGNVFEILA